ncbi:MAG: hypothetical protein AB7F59_03160 [Bdellovibrionales bacterium]
MVARIFLILTLSLVMMSPAQAGMLEGVAPGRSQSRFEQMQSLWSSMKAKVTNVWSQWTKSSEVSREPAQAEASRNVEAEKVLQEVKEARVYSITPSSQAPDASLPRAASGVPVFSLTEKRAKKLADGKTKYVSIKISKIPDLSIGVEGTVTAHQWDLSQMNLPSAKHEGMKELPSPQVVAQKDIQQWLGPVPMKVAPPEKLLIESFDSGLGVVTLKKVEEIAYKMAMESSVAMLPVKEMNEEDLKFIRGLMMYVAGDKCHFASGLFYDLKNSSNTNIKTASTFYLGECLYKMGLYTEAQKYLFETLNYDSVVFKNKVLAALVDFPEEFNVSFGARLEKYVENSQLTTDQKAKIDYMVAVGSLKKESYSTAKKYAELVPEKHSLYIKSQFIAGLADYHLGRAKTGLDRLVKLQTLLPKENVHRDLHALISINLARMAFQDKQYAEASKYYLSIEKNHPLWIQGLVEHAWTQLMAEDHSGAIGNMFSLQSTYLKSVYKPESFIVRTIGYLNLCQYADAYKSLTLLEREYRPWIERIQAYQKNHKSKDYYSTMVRYLTSPSATEVAGLPFQALREMGRHRDFLNLQELINNRIDEGEQYKFIDQYANKDQEKAKWMRAQASQRVKQIEADLLKIKNGVKLAKDENQLRQERANEKNTVEFYDFQLSVFKEASGSYKKLKSVAQANLANEKRKLASQAGEVLKGHLNRIAKDLNQYFQNNEFLRYEVFAGSGENIRFHMAGGEAGEKRIPANVRPAQKDLNWDFEGEFWEDEIGHYKSSLKNNCPKDQAKR